MMNRVMLEEYYSFYENPWRFNIGRVHLNQIIQMHGFGKLYNESKWGILECLNKIDLMPPARSTLERSISSCAFLTAGEAAADLEALGWRECNVRSLQTVRSEAELAFITANEDLPFVPPAVLRGRRRRFRAPPADFVVGGRRPRSKRKRASVNAIVADPASLPHPPPPTSPPPEYPPPLPTSQPPWTPPPPESPPPGFLPL